MRQKAFSICFGALLVSCSSSHFTPGTSGAAASETRRIGVVRPLATERVLYRFGEPPDGDEPFAGLLLGSNGDFYGTTNSGGVTDPSGYEGGTVFEVSPKGKERVLYSFQGGTDGVGTEAGVVADSSGNLYGVTDYGGGATACPFGGCGTVYELMPKGKNYTEKVLYAFQGGKDGAAPLGNLLLVGGVLYGTTADGGGSKVCSTTSGFSGCGTVFSLTPSGSTWTETILHAFKGGKDGAGPRDALVADSSGTLYGTTQYGGGTSGCHPSPYSATDCGTVFSITPSGTERILYRFKGSADGEDPRAALLAGSNGVFYGLTLFGGGATECGSYGCGTFYELIPKAKGYSEKVLYAFGTGSQDGVFPYDQEGLVADSAGNLYGTANNAAAGYGVVFELSPSGSGFTYTDLHTFAAGTDGAYPHGSLVVSGSSLYGTTFEGGNTCNSSSDSCGVVFKVTP